MATNLYTNGGKLHFAPTKGQFGTAGFIGSVAATVMKWQERASLRHHLADLDKVYLTDMGLTVAQVQNETEKTFWQS